MHAGWLGLAVVLILIAGALLGVVSMFLVPLTAAIGLVVLIVWMLRRRAQGKPPIR